MNPSPPTPLEPEIEFLGNVARRTLAGLRAVLFVAGVVAVGFAVRTLASTPIDDGSPAAATPSPTGGLFGMVWLCAGLPLLSPVDWLFGRGRFVALAGAVVLWLGPCLFAHDIDYGWLLRFFASLVAAATLVVWRALWALTKR